MRKGSRAMMKTIATELDDFYAFLLLKMDYTDVMEALHRLAQPTRKSDKHGISTWRRTQIIPFKYSKAKRQKDERLVRKFLKKEFAAPHSQVGRLDVPRKELIDLGLEYLVEKEKRFQIEMNDLFNYLKGDAQGLRVGLGYYPLDRLTDYHIGFRSPSYLAPGREHDTEKLLQYIDRKGKRWKDRGLDPLWPEILELGVEYLIALNRNSRLEKRLFDPAKYDGVILFSGGLDSVALGMILSKTKKKYLPVYISHRSNVGNVTKKEILTAQKLAKKIFGEDLVVIKKESQRLPDWYGKRVLVTDRMPVPKTKKNQRNRIFLDVLKDYGLADKEIWLGVLGIPGAGDRSRAAGRAQDVTKEGLQKHLKKIGGEGTIKVVRDLAGVKTKVDLLKKLPKNFKPDIFKSQSCLMYFNRPCGDCWSCVERVESIMQVYGQDKTPYRQNSKADKIKKQKPANKPKTKGKSMSLKGKKVFFTGTVDPRDPLLPDWAYNGDIKGTPMSRAIIKSRLEELGAILQSAVKKDTDFLLLGSHPPIDKNGKRTKKHHASRIGLAHLDKANKYNIPLVKLPDWLHHLKGKQWKRKSSYYTYG